MQVRILIILLLLVVGKVQGQTQSDSVLFNPGMPDSLLWSADSALKADANLVFTGKVVLGTASYYSSRFEGIKTASGERFSNKAFTGASNSLKMGTGFITLRNDPRVTPVGKFLRITKLNELPQLLNVVKGDMSLVGPRPLVDKTFNAYPEAIRFKVYDSKPGITGIGSVVFRDEESMISASKLPPHEFYEKVIAPYKGALEIWSQQQ